MSDASETGEPDDRPGPPPPGSGRQVLVVALVVVILVGFGGFFLLDGSGDGSTDAGAGLPAVEYETPDGDLVPLAAIGGRPIVLNFFASWCGPCRAELPDFEEVSGRFADDVKFLSLAELDRPEDAAALIAETGVTYEWGIDPDGALFEEFSADVMPTTVLLGADGRVVEVHGGILTADDLTALIEDELL